SRTPVLRADYFDNPANSVGASHRCPAKLEDEEFPVGHSAFHHFSYWIVQRIEDGTRSYHRRNSRTNAPYSRSHGPWSTMNDRKSGETAGERRCTPIAATKIGVHLRASAVPNWWAGGLWPDIS